MASARAAERAAVAAAASTATLLTSAVLFSLAPGRSIPVDVGVARDRLERAKQVRYDATTRERDERFDQLVAALAAGLGDAPEALRDAVASVQVARAAERAAASSSSRRDARAVVAFDSGVDLALARSSRILAYLAAEQETHASSVRSSGALVGAAVAAVGSLVLLALALARRRAERRRIAELVGAVWAAHDGTLAFEVGRCLAVAAGRASAQIRRSTQTPAGGVPPASEATAARQTEPSSFTFGRIIEIVPDRGDEWRGA
jgi:hypothetical protein